MPRHAVKLLLLDPEDRLLLIHARDPESRTTCWYPVGGGVEAGESLQEAAAREAYEETGLTSLTSGQQVWRREHTYRYNGRVQDVLEEWLLCRVASFDPSPQRLSAYESESILGFRWWRAQELITSTEIIFPPKLGQLLLELLADGVPESPIAIR